MLPMHRLALLVALTACSSGREPGAEPAAPGAPLPLAPAVTSPPSAPSSPRTTTAQLEAAVAADLAVLGAATAKDLLPGAPPRPLVVAAQFPLPYSEGRTILAVVGLAPGEPTVRYKPSGDKYRTSPSFSVEVKANPRLPDTGPESAAFKLDRQGRAAPKNDFQILNPYSKKSHESQFNAFEDAIMEAVHFGLK